MLACASAWNIPRSNVVQHSLVCFTVAQSVQQNVRETRCERIWIRDAVRLNTGKAKVCGLFLQWRVFGSSGHDCQPVGTRGIRSIPLVKKFARCLYLQSARKLDSELRKRYSLDSTDSIRQCRPARRGIGAELCAARPPRARGLGARDADPSESLKRPALPD